MSWDVDVAPHFGELRMFTAKDMVRQVYGPDSTATNRNGGMSRTLRKAVKYGFIRCVGWTESRSSNGRTPVYTAYKDVLPMNTEDDYIPEDEFRAL